MQVSSQRGIAGLSVSGSSLWICHLPLLHGHWLRIQQQQQRPLKRGMASMQNSRAQSKGSPHDALILSTSKYSAQRMRFYEEQGAHREPLRCATSCITALSNNSQSPMDAGAILCQHKVVADKVLALPEKLCCAKDDDAPVILRIVDSQDYTLLLGMPGTGKSSTIVEAVIALLAAGASVVLMSYTNRCAPWIVQNCLLLTRRSLPPSPSPQT